MIYLRMCPWPRSSQACRNASRCCVDLSMATTIPVVAAPDADPRQLCGSYSGQPQGQSACSVGVVQEMWPEDELRVQGADDGPVPVPGSTTRDDCDGPGRVAAELCGVGDEREDLCREAAGASRPNFGGKQRSRNDSSGCEGQTEPRSGPIGGDRGIPASRSEVPGKVEAEGGSIYKVDGGKDNSLDYDAIDRIYKEPEYDTAEKPSDGRDCMWRMR